MLTQSCRAPEPAGPPAEDPRLIWIRQQQGRLWRYLRLLGADRGEAEDLCQDTFVRVLQRRQLERLEDLEPLLFTAARNLWIDQLRARGRRKQVAWCEAVEQWIAAQPAAVDDRRIAALARCLSQLNPRVRQAIQDHHVEGRSLQDLATDQGMGLEGVRAMLRRARTRLRDCTARQLRDQEEK